MKSTRKIKRNCVSLIFVLILSGLKAQEPPKVLSSIFNEALTDRTAYENLGYICKNIKGRLLGSAASMKAVEYTRQALVKAGADSVWLQQIMVPHWVRGTEKCRINSAVTGHQDLHITALGTSVGTQQQGITSRVIEVLDFEELKNIGKQRLEGKIVFFNRPADPTLTSTFAAYSGAVNQRTLGASEASRYGAAAVIVRSPNPFLDDFPHTGVTRYAEGVTKIPAVAVSTKDAELLSQWLKRDSMLTAHLVSTCKNLPDTLSYNVIGEIRGTGKPNEFITVGGHLDSWDLAEGAHDDAGGCVQAIEMIRIYKKLGIKPKRTIRAVMFMNEEMSGTGGKTYAAEAKRKGEVHCVALESDRGVMSPRGFGFDAEGQRLDNLTALAKYFAPFNIRDFEKGGGGSDISPLKALGALQIGYIPDSQRYFTFHHSANDTFELVNIRELQLGSAAIASLIYLLDLFDY